MGELYDNLRAVAEQHLITQWQIAKAVDEELEKVKSRIKDLEDRVTRLEPTNLYGGY